MPELESRKFSRGIGLAGCEVSVPLSRDEILDFAARLGAPDLASSSEWAEATSLAEPGDHMRRVYCPRNTDNFFGVFRGGSVLFKFRSEEHTSELQSLMRISYAVFCLKKKNK